LLGACGSSGRGVSDAARNRLTPLVDQIRMRAAAHDASGADLALASLRQRVTQLQQRGAIDDADAAAIMRAAGAVESKLALVTTTTTTTTTVPPPPPPDEKHDHGAKKGHHKHDGDGGD
jgi:hypothetical protein